MSSITSSLLDLLDLQSHSHRTALTYHEKDSELVIHQSYHELDERSDSISQALGRLPCKERVVALAIHQHHLVPAAILGTLKTGAAFLYLDVDQPSARKAECLISAGASFILTDHTPSPLPGWEEIPSSQSSLKILQKVNLANDEAVDQDLAYVIHTSGSTGKPKAVRVYHSCIIPNISDLKEEFRMAPDDSILMASPFTFDPSVVDLFLGLSSGARLVMVHPSIKAMPDKLSSIIRQERITFLQSTPSLFLRLDPSTICWAFLRLVVLGGEPFPALETLRSSYRPGSLQFYNIYGVTEVSCWATLKRVDPTSEEPVDLGRPLSGTRLIVLDDDGKEVIHQGEGSLLIAGQRVNSESPIKTGDRVELINGRLFYRGRTDGTIKRQGKRLNLHSVELTALASGLVRQCCALIRRNLLLLAAVLLESGSSSSAQLATYFAENGAAHEIPDEIVQLDAIPVTPHGKVDKAALLDTIGNSLPTDERDWAALLAEEWPCRPVQDEANFIRSGGDSLAAVRLSAKLEKRLDLPLTGLVDVLLNRSYSEVKRYIQQEMDKPPDCLLPAVSITQRSRTAHRYDPVRIPRPYDVQLDWTFDLEKCVDASPLIIERNEDRSGMVYIGSHSHLFAAIQLDTGQEVWSVRLPDRIESSACSDPSGSLVFVGCYDGCLYCLDGMDGRIRWKFPTGDAVKSSPTCTDQGTVIFGSHDRTLYCLKTEDGSLVWSSNFSSGSVFASPAWNATTDGIVAASLDGTCALLSASTGKVLWTVRLAKPIFSSPAWMGDECCIAASVDGLVHCLSASDSGRSVWTFQASGPIFSSLTVSVDEKVLFGSHDHSVYCLDGPSGRQLWRAELSSPVYASPFILSAADGSRADVICMDTKGSLRFVALEDGSSSNVDGHPLMDQLGGEVFSSPVASADGRRLLVGCRNNFLYSYSLSGTFGNRN